MGRLKQLWGWITHLSTVYSLWTLGGSTVGAALLTGVATAFTNWPTWLYVVLFLGLAVTMAAVAANQIEKRSAQQMSLDLEVTELDPNQIPNWDNDWRVSLRILNLGDSADVSAYLPSPILGVGEHEYGDINLHWETVPDIFTTLVRRKPERLHIARVSSRRTVRFLSPGVFGGLPREFQQKELAIQDGPIRGSLLFSTAQGCQQKRWLEIHLDHQHRPKLIIGDPEPC